MKNNDPENFRKFEKKKKRKRKSVRVQLLVQSLQFCFIKMVFT